MKSLMPKSKTKNKKRSQITCISMGHIEESCKVLKWFTENGGDGRVARRCWVKLPVPGRPTNLVNRRAWACYACRWGCLDISLSSIISLFSLSLGDRPI